MASETNFLILNLFFDFLRSDFNLRQKPLEAFKWFRLGSGGAIRRHPRLLENEAHART